MLFLNSFLIFFAILFSITIILLVLLIVIEIIKKKTLSHSPSTVENFLFRKLSSFRFLYYYFSLPPSFSSLLFPLPYSFPFTSCSPFSSSPFFSPFAFPANSLFFLPLGIFSLLGLSFLSTSILFPSSSQDFWSPSVFGLGKITLAFRRVWATVGFFLIFS
jgi:hypothetical protein